MTFNDLAGQNHIAYDVIRPITHPGAECLSHMRGMFMNACLSLEKHYKTNLKNMKSALYLQEMSPPLMFVKIFNKSSLDVYISKKYYTDIQRMLFKICESFVLNICKTFTKNLIFF